MRRGTWGLPLSRVGRVVVTDRVRTARAIRSIRIYREMMLDSSVVCRRALGCEWGGGSHGPLQTRYSKNRIKTRRPCLKKRVCRSWPQHAWPHSVYALGTHTHQHKTPHDTQTDGPLNGVSRRACAGVCLITYDVPRTLSPDSVRYKTMGHVRCLVPGDSLTRHSLGAIVLYPLLAPLTGAELAILLPSEAALESSQPGQGEGIG